MALQERIGALATGEEVPAYGALRRLAYSIAVRSACGDLLAQKEYEELFDDFQTLGLGALAPV